MGKKISIFVIIIGMIIYMSTYLCCSMLDNILLGVGISMGYDKACTYDILKTPTFQRNSVIVFKDEDDIQVIKRIVGIPGDTVEVTKTEVVINGIKLVSEQPVYLYKENVYKLGEDEYFVLGDNYQYSYDSRYYGPINKSQIIADSEYFKSALDTDDPIVKILNYFFIEKRHGMSAKDFCQKTMFSTKPLS